MRSEPEATQPLSTEAASDVRLVAKGGATQFVGQIAHQAFGFGFTVLAVRLLGTSGFGVYRQVMQVLSIGGIIGLFGLHFAAMHFIARARAAGDPARVRGSARVGAVGSIITSSCVALVLVFGADLLAGAFSGVGDRGEVVDLFRLGSLYVPFFALMLVFAYCTQGFRTMVPVVVVTNVVQPALRLIIGAIALWAGLAVTGAIGSAVVSMMIGTALAVWFFRRELNPEERHVTPKYPTSQMVKFALPQAGANLLDVQALGIGILVTGLLSSDAEVGVFAIAISLLGPAQIFLIGITNIWAPVVSDLHERGELDRLASLYQTINRWIATFALPVLALLVIEAGFFIRLVAGRYPSGAAATLVILAAGSVLFTVAGPANFLISMTGRPGINFVNSAVGVAAYIVLGLYFVPRYGSVGTAVVDAIVLTSVTLARVVQARVLIGILPFGRSFLKPVLATALGAATLIGTRLTLISTGFVADSLAIEVLRILGAFVVYVAVLRRLGLDPEERHVFERIKGRLTEAFSRRPSR